MDVASGVLGAISLGIQIFETVQKARKFLRGIQNAPHEISMLNQKVDQLYLTIISVNTLIEQQQQCTGLSCSINLLDAALQSCNDSVENLDLVIKGLQTSFARPQKIRRTWASIVTTLQKDEIQRLHNRITESISYLTTALMINSSNFTLYQSQRLSPANPYSGQKECDSGLELVTASELSREVSKNLRLHQDTNISQLATIETDTLVYRGFFGFIRHQTCNRFLKPTGQYQNQPLSELNRIMINLAPLRMAIQYEYRGRFGLPKSLSFYSVAPSDSDIFIACRWGTLEEVRTILIDDKISPIIQDEDGNTMLHHASRSHDPELCALILGLGVDPDHCNAQGDKALAAVDRLYGIIQSLGNVESTLRILASAQDEVSTYDLTQFSKEMKGPDTIQYMITILQSLDELTREEIDDFALVSALGACARASRLGSTNLLPESSSRGLSGIFSMIRSLLQRPFRTLHESITLAKDRGSKHSSEGSERITLLDQLFLDCQDPFEGSVLGRHWLTLLQESGIDPTVYLQEEEYLHADRQYMIAPLVFEDPHYEISRKLVFRYEELPTVAWDWWLDPNNAGSLVCHEFRHMNIHHGEYDLTFDKDYEDSGVRTFPFKHSEWSEWRKPKDEDVFDDDYDNASEQWCRKNKLGKDRFARGLRKKSIKQARAHGVYPSGLMPGSWPES